MTRKLKNIERKRHKSRYFMRSNAFYGCTCWNHSVILNIMIGNVWGILLFRRYSLLFTRIQYSHLINRTIFQNLKPSEPQTRSHCTAKCVCCAHTAWHRRLLLRVCVGAYTLFTMTHHRSSVIMGPFINICKRGKGKAM